MKKKSIALALTSLLLTGLMAGCGNGDTGKKSSLKVGMVTDSGTIDDKSFNQGSWEGILKAKDEFGITEKYLQPDGQTLADYTSKIKDLYDGGFKFIVAPGFKFEQAIFESQDKYKDAKFIIIDGSPNNGLEGDKKQAKVGDNTVAVFFAEQESGFMAGVAAAVELKDGDLGFVGGMEIPAVQKFNWGFQQGVKYANEKLGTKVSLKAENIVYQGTFNSADAGQQIAATMYSRGVKAIFTAAGGTGTGVITEAKTRAKKGEKVWAIGVDTDQYDEGIYENGKSAVLTSAMKKIDNTTYKLIKDELDGNFPGGQTLTLDAKTDSVGIPDKNPNLSEATTKTCKDVFEKIKSGEIKVSNEQGNLIK
ncbi:BMP family lipoprotein [Clostridium cibarium]|uniref:BMP family ABC transporter substrate-binding protein n=2 Tax=Clostridium TaxID=1485 RepID=A0ABR8PYS9_9CLOT|nr:BMP family ABC transporter substrate-binding protein [Clostridium cibarium]MBD7913331.1 BMP family ABC transporter substrate-binding protein [Clostridium cibarium]